MPRLLPQAPNWILRDKSSSMSYLVEHGGEAVIEKKNKSCRPKREKHILPDDPKCYNGQSQYAPRLLGKKLHLIEPESDLTLHQTTASIRRQRNIHLSQLIVLLKGHMVSFSNSVLKSPSLPFFGY